METRANYVVVGIFTLAAVLAAFAFVYWTAGIGDRGDIAQLRFRIPGSASGLARGSVVLFNGVKVGDIRRVYIDVTNPAVAIADAEVDRLTPVTASTQADLGLAGLTGTANIELRGGNPSEPNLFDLAEQQGRVAEMVANPSAVTNLLESAQNIFKRADSVLTELEGFVGDARGPLTETLRNVEQFSDALGRNAEGIDAFLASVTSMSTTLEGVSDQLESSLAAVEDLIQAVDRDKVASTVDNIEQITRKLDEASTNVGEIMAGVDAAVTSVGQFASSANETLARVDGIIANVDKVVAGVDPAAIGTALTNFEQASVSVNAAVNDVSKVTERFGARAEDIDKIITDAQQLAERLNQASSRIDGVLVKVDDLLGSGEAEGVMADASETLKAFREVADTLNARMGTITDGLARFSGQGLRDVEALVGDSRRAITRIEQAITDLERNPQRILSGGEGDVRQFDGRARR
jgi:phospholipid/cholesterol/gamma-HCH transport system substrate-binding protein